MKRRKVIERGRISGAIQLFNDYFAPNPVFDEGIFRRRFRMSRRLFDRIHDGVLAHDDYFKQKYNAARIPGLSPYQKMTSAMRQLAYGMPADTVDEYLRIGESTSIDCLKNFCIAIIDVFGEEYLRTPNEEDIRRITAVNERRGFPGMLGSLDCMHWTWKNCPAAMHGQFKGKDGVPTVILEAVAS